MSLASIAEKAEQHSYKEKKDAKERFSPTSEEACDLNLTIRYI